MKKIALSVSYAAPPHDEADKWRIEKYLALASGFDAQITPLYLNQWENKAAEIANEFDGLILAGGADLPTEWYGETPLEGAGLELVSERRPLFEKQIVGDFESAEKPVFGICYGCQFLNVLKGGSLFQDLKLQLGTDLKHVDGHKHLVQVERDSRLFEIVGETQFEVPSYHHQAVKIVAPGASTNCAASDGVIEGVEWNAPFFLGVQWHPERDLESNATQSLMRAFLAACQ